MATGVCEIKHLGMQTASANICGGMGRSQGLGEHQRGIPPATMWYYKLEAIGEVTRQEVSHEVANVLLNQLQISSRGGISGTSQGLTVARRTGLL